jgi:hypothetical protein
VQRAAAALAKASSCSRGREGTRKATREAFMTSTEEGGVEKEAPLLPLLLLLRLLLLALLRGEEK